MPGLKNENTPILQRILERKLRWGVDGLHFQIGSILRIVSGNIKICRMKSTALFMFLLLAAGRGQGWGRVHSRRWPWRERQVNQSQNIGLGCGR